MKNKKTLIIIFTIIILTILSGAVYAYFASQIESNGDFSVSLDNANVRITKNQILNGKLNVELENSGKEEQYARIKIVAPEFIKLTSTSTYWKLEDDGYWYYSNMLEPGEKSSVLQLDINVKGTQNRDFKIVTNVESTNVWYDGNGRPYANWEFTYKN